MHQFIFFVSEFVSLVSKQIWNSSQKTSPWTSIQQLSIHSIQCSSNFALAQPKKPLWALECSHDIWRASLQAEEEGWKNDQQTVSGSHLQSSSSSPDELTSQKSYKPSPTKSTFFMGPLGIQTEVISMVTVSCSYSRKLEQLKTLHLGREVSGGRAVSFMGLTSSCEGILWPFVSSVLFFCSVLAGVINNPFVDFTWSDLCLRGRLQ